MIYHNDDTSCIEYTLWLFMLISYSYGCVEAAQNSHDELWNPSWLETDGDPCPDAFVEMDQVYPGRSSCIKVCQHIGRIDVVWCK